MNVPHIMVARTKEMKNGDTITTEAVLLPATNFFGLLSPFEFEDCFDLKGWKTSSDDGERKEDKFTTQWSNL